jgi:antitoxin Phd
MSWYSLARLARFLGDFMDWRLADAKNRFSELFTQALTLGPQRVRRFKNAVIVLSEQDYERITGRRPSFKDHLIQGESFEGLELSRDSGETTDP